MTVGNALTAAVAHLQTQGPGHKITVPAAAWDKLPESIEGWCVRRGLLYSQEGHMVTLEIDANHEP